NTFNITDGNGRSNSGTYNILNDQGRQMTADQQCGLVAHEVGHDLGLPDEYVDKDCPLRDTYGPNNDLMTSGGIAPTNSLQLYTQDIATILAPLCGPPPNQPKFDPTKDKCFSGYVVGPDGTSSVPDPNAKKPKAPSVCPDGQESDDDGNCPDVTTASCTLDPTTCQWSCEEGAETPPAMELKDDGTCGPVQTTCPDGSPADENGYCAQACWDGSTPDPTNGCPTCPDGTP